MKTSLGVRPTLVAVCLLVFGVLMLILAYGPASASTSARFSKRANVTTAAPGANTITYTLIVTNPTTFPAVPIVALITETLPISTSLINTSEWLGVGDTDQFTASQVVDADSTAIFTFVISVAPAYSGNAVTNAAQALVAISLTNSIAVFEDDVVVTWLAQAPISLIDGPWLAKRASPMSAEPATGSVTFTVLVTNPIASPPSTVEAVITETLPPGASLMQPGGWNLVLFSEGVYTAARQISSGAATTLEFAILPSPAYRGNWITNTALASIRGVTVAAALTGTASASISWKACSSQSRCSVFLPLVMKPPSPCPIFGNDCMEPVPAEYNNPQGALMLNTPYYGTVRRDAGVDTPDRRDFYTVTLEAAKRYSLTLSGGVDFTTAFTAQVSGADLDIRLLYASVNAIVTSTIPISGSPGNLIASEKFGGAAEAVLGFQVPTGVYRVAVYAWSPTASPVPYHLEFRDLP